MRLVCIPRGAYFGMVGHVGFDRSPRIGQPEEPWVDQSANGGVEGFAAKKFKRGSTFIGGFLQIAVGGAVCRRASVCLRPTLCMIPLGGEWAIEHAQHRGVGWRRGPRAREPARQKAHRLHRLQWVSSLSRSVLPPASCVLGPTLVFSVRPTDPRFSTVPLRCPLPLRLAGPGHARPGGGFATP